jgi:hypothetical protein
LLTRRPIQSYPNRNSRFGAPKFTGVLLMYIRASRFSASHRFVLCPSLVRFPSASDVFTSGLRAKYSYPVTTVTTSGLVPWRRTPTFVTASHTGPLPLATASAAYYSFS